MLGYGGLAEGSAKENLPNISSLSYIRTMCCHPHAKLCRVPRLHKDRPWACELANQALSAAETRNDTTARYTLHHVFTIPGHEMAVIDDVLFTFDELFLV